MASVDLRNSEEGAVILQSPAGVLVYCQVWTAINKRRRKKVKQRQKMAIL